MRAAKEIQYVSDRCFSVAVLISNKYLCDMCDAVNYFRIIRAKQPTKEVSTWAHGLLHFRMHSAVRTRACSDRRYVPWWLAVVSKSHSTNGRQMGRLLHQSLWRGPVRSLARALAITLNLTLNLTLTLVLTLTLTLTLTSSNHN